MISSRDVVNLRQLGGQHDAVSGAGMYKIGLRYYDQNHGRWTQTDPAERVITPTQPPEANVYNYVGCEPINYTDPTGLLRLSQCDRLSALTGLAVSAATLPLNAVTVGLIGLGAGSRRWDSAHLQYGGGLRGAVRPELAAIRQ